MVDLTDQDIRTAQSRALTWLLTPLAAFSLTRLLVIIAFPLADLILPNFQNTQIFIGGDILGEYIAAWNKWDTVYYVKIIEEGYEYVPGAPRNTVAYFPMYPLLVASLQPLFAGNTLLTGIILSNLCMFVALIGLYQLTLQLTTSAAVAARAVFYIAAFPLSFYMSGVYTESLFLLLVVFAFYAAHHRAWLAAGLLGMVASATRVNGIILAPALLILWLVDVGWSPRQLLDSAIWRKLVEQMRVPFFISLTFMGPGLYMLYLDRAFGEPLAFSLAQRGWRQEPGLQPLLNDIGLLIEGKLWPSFTMDLFHVFLSVCMIVPVWRRLGASYAIFTALSIVIPVSTGVFAFTRYFSVIFPVFIILGIWGEKRWLDVTLRVVFLALLPIFTMLFVKWIFLG